MITIIEAGVDNYMLLYCLIYYALLLILVYLAGVSLLLLLSTYTLIHITRNLGVLIITYINLSPVPYRSLRVNVRGISSFEVFMSN